MSEHDVRAALSEAVKAEDRGGLWRALEPVRAKLASEPDLAHAWAEALRTSPARKTLEEEAEVILDAFPYDAEIVGAACAALVRAAERRPIDEPPLSIGPASIAAGATERCLAKIGGADARLFALRGNALRLLGPARHDDAVRALERAIAIEPEVGEHQVDLALAFKAVRRYDAAYDALLSARARLGDRKPILWNLAIAATALGEGERAADAWRALSIDARLEGSLPFVEGLPPARVRLATLGSGHAVGTFVPDEAAGFEIVWVQPISPCHGVIRSPTFRDAIADFGDVVLWDGAPVSVDADGVPCFPVLGVLRHGDERRFRFLAREATESSIEALGRALPPEIVVYRHGARVELVCPRCAAGERLTKHEHLPPEPHRVAFGKIVVDGARDLGGFARELEAARRAHPDVLLAIPGLYEAIGDTKQAGKHHKRWGEIERSVPR